MADPDMKLRERISSSGQNFEENKDKRLSRNLSTASRPHTTGMYKGLILAFICGVMYSLCAVIVKFVKNIHPAQITMYRFIVMFVMSLPQSVKTGENLLGPRELRFLLFLRGIIGTANVILNYLAFQYLPLGEATVIIYSAPVFVNVAAKIFIKERCGIFQSVNVLITVVGIIFILNVPTMFSLGSFSYTTEHIYGLIAAFSSLITFTGLFIVVRKLKRVHHSINMLNFGWVGFIGTTILTAITGHFQLPTCGPQKWLVVLVGVLSHAGATLFIVALQLENAGPVATVMSASDLTVSFCWQTFFFHDYPDDFSIVGFVLLGGSIVLAGLSKWVSSLPPHSTPAKYFRFLLM